MMTWTNEKIDLLRHLWSSGLAASKIKDELGVSRSAVLGKVHRLNLPNRGKPPAARARPRRETRPKPPEPKPTAARARPRRETRPEPPEPPAAPIYALFDEPLIANASVLQINERTCKWPIGDPRAVDFHFCARLSDAGIPYCGHHARIAYTTRRGFTERPADLAGKLSGW